MKKQEPRVWKFGIIGSGMIADFHAMAIQSIPRAELTAIYGRNSGTVKKLGTKYQCDAFFDIDDFLNSDIDIVTIATPSGAHLEPAIKAAHKGKHVISEKPLEITPGRIDKMIAVCNEAGVLLSGIFNRRFNPAVRLFKEAIDGGRFGVIALADAQIRWYRDQEYYDSGMWRGTLDLDGGGALMNQSIHTIDLLLFLMGPVKRLSATMDCLSHRGIEVEDTAVAILEFENGARGSIQGSTSCWSMQGHPAEINICGSEGSVFMRDDYFLLWDFKKKNPEDAEVEKLMVKTSADGIGANDPMAINYEGHKLNFEDVILALEQGTTPMVTGEESKKSVELINAIYYSARNNGQWVDLKNRTR